MNPLRIFLLSIFFIKAALVCAISTHEVLNDKRIEFKNNAKRIINESYLVDKNEKLLGSSLRTYKYYLVKSTTEFRAIFIFDDLNVNKATELGIRNAQHQADILNVEENVNNIYPLDEISTFNEVLYRERKMFSLETAYSTTSYVLAKFVFDVNVEEEDEEDIMSLLIETELNMKKKKLDVLTKEDGGAQQGGNINSSDIKSNHSQSVEMYKQKHPQVFTQFVGLLVSIVSMATSISGAISAVSSAFSGAPSPSPPEFLGDEAWALPTYEERKVSKREAPKGKKGKRTPQEDPYYDDDYDDDDYYDDEYYDDDYYDDEYYDDDYYDDYGDDYRF
ncbi:Mitochondrial carrier protein [Plasmodium coatneyi]|uniref:Mitochondrial carrier protein n=1 Tax=Plasmodium coatneyi TaxID=208452 RepID=A0A1B1DU18_9APIC|nr:Mitochondrial carrier protein [Plasmodium coatneyi]ANQ06281.1 Mitochondrial carrier protein [Plasmodium coatneyi]